MAAERVNIIHLLASPHGLTCRIPLAEKKIGYELEEVHKFRSSMATLEEVKESCKSLPVLIHNGKEIYEFRTVVEYIDEAWKSRSAFLPLDPYKRAQARYWFDFIDKEVNLILVINRQLVAISLFSAPSLVAWLWGLACDTEAAKKELVSTLKELEVELGDKPYFGGESLGLVDIVLLPHYAWFHTYERCADFCIQAHCPKLIGWAKQCLRKASASQCLPDPDEVYENAMKLKERVDEITPVVAIAKFFSRLASRCDSEHMLGDIFFGRLVGAEAWVSESPA
ncbi:probable glutathione S-transferase parA [Punica granatum]|uniref:glutathione transferase n=1 Tax=Punica granatum TaxID=22663 RepID=A0A218XVB5_PUNGR|nr:probable glutathione S-transferase parA [Punica granatum]OWM88539.1 hypothetical protein CDL15_Pgr002306 [Punica granatum]